MEKPEPCIHGGRLLAWCNDCSHAPRYVCVEQVWATTEALRILAAWLPRAAAWVEAGGKEERRG